MFANLTPTACFTSFLSRNCSTTTPQTGTQVLQVLGVAFAAVLFIGTIFAGATVTTKVAELSALGTKGAAQVQHAAVLAGLSAVALMVAYWGILLIEWLWSQLRTKRIQQFREQKIASFCKNLALPDDDDKQEQLAILIRKWSVDLLYQLYITNIGNGFSASLQADGLKLTTILAVEKQLQQAME